MITITMNSDIMAQGMGTCGHLAGINAIVRVGMMIKITGTNAWLIDEISHLSNMNASDDTKDSASMENTNEFNQMNSSDFSPV